MININSKPFWDDRRKGHRFTTAVVFSKHKGIPLRYYHKRKEKKKKKEEKRKRKNIHLIMRT